MNSWQGTLAALSLLVIAALLLYLHWDMLDVIHAIDTGKFMPFIYTGQK